MAINVYQFPPVGAIGSEWTWEMPVQRSRSMLTGRDFTSAIGRRRRRATVIVSALAKNRSGAGYSEMLKRYLDGGINAVRLNSYPINWYLDAVRQTGIGGSSAITWEGNDIPFAWKAGTSNFVWITADNTGNLIEITGFTANSVTLSGLPASTLVARAGDFVEMFRFPGDTSGDISQVVTEATSDASGVVTLSLYDALPAASYSRIGLGAVDTGVFKAESMPRAVQRVNSNWTYEWSFREIFADEVGGFVEVNPWL